MRKKALKWRFFIYNCTKNTLDVWKNSIEYMSPISINNSRAPNNSFFPYISVGMKCVNLPVAYNSVIFVLF